MCPVRVCSDHLAILANHLLLRNLSLSLSRSTPTHRHGHDHLSTDESGHAKVLKSYRDEDGDLAYDVKYIVGGRKVKCIWAQFVLPPQFNDE